MFQKEGVKKGSISVEKLCSIRPLELTFRLDKMEVMGDFNEQFTGITKISDWSGSKNKCTILSRSFDLNERKGIRSKLEDVGSRILFQGNRHIQYVCMYVCRGDEPMQRG